jgi:hypothetical protein
MLARGQTDRARRRVAQGGQAFQPGADVVEGGPQRRHKLLACLGRRDAARGPRQEPHAEAFFQTPHGVAQRGLRGSEPRRRAREAALLRHREEGHQVAEVLSFHA